MMMKVDRYKVAIFFYMLIVLQVQPEFNQDHNHEHHHKHPHDHDHDHHRRSQIRKASRIYNGRRTPPGQAKFMAVMVKFRVLNHCSAVIITGDMLLTAAHCLYNESHGFLTGIRILPRAFPIQTYRNNPFSDHPWIKRIQTFWIHPRFHPNTSNARYDIAIIRIGPQPWPLGGEIDTALMPVRVRQFDWHVIKAYGYGRERGEIIASFLNELDFRYLWNETFCEDVFDYGRSNNNDDRNVIFCVTNWSPDQSRNSRIFRNIAYGDSGGGVFIKGSVYRFDRSTNRIIIRRGLVLAGIASKADDYLHSISDMIPPYGTSAVNVTTLMPWINSIVGIDFGTYPFSIQPYGTRIG